MTDTRDILRILSFGDGDVDEDTGASVNFTDDGYDRLTIALTNEDGTEEFFNAKITRVEN